MFFAFCAIGTLLLLKQKIIFILFYALGWIFVFLGLILTNLLKPIYIIWIRFAYALNYINTRLILIIVFYLIFAPIGLVMWLLKIDLLDRKVEKDKQTYWKRKENEFKPLNYERRF